MICGTLPLLLALSTALAAPPSLYEDYPVVVPEKRAALVLDRLLIALQRALHDSPPHYERPPDGPRTAALRFSDNDMKRKDFEDIVLPTELQDAMHDSLMHYENAPVKSLSTTYAIRITDIDMVQKRRDLGKDWLLIELQNSGHNNLLHYESPPVRSLPGLRISDHMVSAPEKRMDVDWDRLQIAVQNALHDSPPDYQRLLNGPRATLRLFNDEMSDRLSGAGGERADEWLSPEELRVAPLRPSYSDMTGLGLQRRGQSGGAGLRGRVLRCYFNAVTCF